MQQAQDSNSADNDDGNTDAAAVDNLVPLVEKECYLVEYMLEPR